MENDTVTRSHVDGVPRLTAAIGYPETLLTACLERSLGDLGTRRNFWETGGSKIDPFRNA